MERKMQSGMKMLVLTVAAGLVLGVSAAQASLKDIKAYKEAYPEAKPKCMSCHNSDKPTKDGDKSLNDYGTAAVKAAAETGRPSADTYKAVGTVEDFKQKGEAVTQ